MKQIEIPFAENLNKHAGLQEVSTFLNTLEWINIDTQSWPEFRYKPLARFVIAHSGDCIFLKFDVLEKIVRAVYRANNEPVSQDSCVEFFIALDDREHYYNFEFNCIGTCKAAYGNKNRNERDKLDDGVIDQISRRSVITNGRLTARQVSWELTVSIPLQVFCFNDIESLTGLKGTANFYKCGDDLPEPHFVVWNEVKAPKPDFHLPECFGNIHFL